MFGGFYTAASGVLTQQRTLNVLANNMANDKTPGFKTESVVTTTFEHELLTRQEANGNSARIGKGAPIRIVQDVPSSFDPALLEETGRPFDIAINGEGFFTVRNAEGTDYLTRNGGFELDDEGFLALRGAGRVMGVKGELELKDSAFVVEEDGSVYDSQGTMVDQLLISAPTPGTQLAKFANGMYQMDENPPVRPGTEPQLDAAGQPIPGTGQAAAGDAVAPGVVRVAAPNLVQGVLEGSNIDMNREMSLLMETQRNFQSCAKSMQIIDQLNQKTVNLAGM